MTCKKCKSKNVIMVEYYNVGLPPGVGYDGWSELRCQDCGTRVGRWSKKILKENEMEHRWGGEPVKVK